VFWFLLVVQYAACEAFVSDSTAWDYRRSLREEVGVAAAPAVAAATVVVLIAAARHAKIGASSFSAFSVLQFS